MQLSLLKDFIILFMCMYMLMDAQVGQKGALACPDIRDTSSCELSNMGMRFQTLVFGKNKLIPIEPSLHAPQQLILGAGKEVFWCYYLSYILKWK